MFDGKQDCVRLGNGEFKWKKDNGSNVSFTYQEAQQGFDGLLKTFRETYFGTTIAEIESMKNEFGSNWKIDWNVTALPTGMEGATGYNYKTSTITIGINYTAFKDPRYLALAVGHELVHALDIANGNHFKWGLEFGTDDSIGSPLWVIMETHAWQWTLQAEQDPRINMKLLEGADAHLNSLVPKLPTGFTSFNR